MRKRLFAAALVLLAVLGAWQGLRYFRSDERLIGKVLRECAEAAEFRSGEAPAGAMLKLAGLNDRTEETIDVSLRIRGREFREKMERKELIARLTASRKYLSYLEIDLGDLDIAVSGERAEVEASAQLRCSGSGAEKWRDSALEDVHITLVKSGGRWRISSVAGREFMER